MQNKDAEFLFNEGAARGNIWLQYRARRIEEGKASEEDQKVLREIKKEKSVIERPKQ